MSARAEMSSGCEDALDIFRFNRHRKIWRNVGKLFADSGAASRNPGSLNFVTEAIFVFVLIEAIKAIFGFRKFGLPARCAKRPATAFSWFDSHAGDAAVGGLRRSSLLTWRIPGAK
jgi:hypothetical protein